MRFRIWLAGLVVGTLAVFMALTMSATANPIPVSGGDHSHDASPGVPTAPLTPDFGTWQAGAAYLALVNLPLDLLILSALALGFCLLFGAKRMDRISRNSALFVGSVVVAGAAIALVGGAIDFAFFYQHQGSSSLYKEGWYQSEGTNPYIYGFIFIFASIWLSTVLISRFNLTASTILALGMAVISPISWWMLQSRGAFPPELAILAVIPIPAFLYLLYRWHSKSVAVELRASSGTVVSNSS